MNDSNYSDLELIEMIQAGGSTCNSAIKLLSNLHKHSMLRQIERFGKGQLDKEYIWQRSLCVFYESVITKKYEKKYLTSTTIGGFLYGTVRNLCFAELRRRGRLVELGGHAEDMVQIRSYEFDGFPEETSVSSNPVLVELVKKGLGKECMRILLLYYYEEMTIDQMAKKLGRSRSAVAKKYQRCKKQARAIVTQSK